MDRRAPTAALTAPPLATPDPGLGDRVRRLRNARGLTQTELAEARVSKEYISQIETGKTRPTSQTLEWLPGRPRGAPPHPLGGGSRGAPPAHQARRWPAAGGAGEERPPRARAPGGRRSRG